MERSNFSEQIQAFDNRRNIVIPGNHEETLLFCINHFLALAYEAIDERGYFAVALSGGSTPKAIFHGLSEEGNRHKIDWSRVILFWSDERCVPPDNLNSNYRMAMDSGFSTLPIPLENIHRMKAEEDPELNAKAYEELITEKLAGEPLDLVMLGMGEDGHTASLFPKTHALHSADDRLVVANFVPKLDVWRMTMTYKCINSAHHIAIYVLGSSKADMVNEVLNAPYDPDTYPVQGIGTPNHKALWIADNDAAAKIKNHSS